MEKAMSNPLSLKKLKVPVTQQFYDLARHSEDAFNFAHGNGDFLILEWYLLKKGLVDEPHNWRHDFINGPDLVDCKCINTKYFNIHSNKMKQYKKSIVDGELTHFLFFRITGVELFIVNLGMITEVNPYEGRMFLPKDIVHIDIVGYCDARTIIKNAVPSEFADTTHFVFEEAMNVHDEKFKLKGT